MFNMNKKETVTAVIVGSLVASAAWFLLKKGKTMSCGLFGHNGAFLNFDPEKLSLKCSNCGWESAGWDLKKEKE